MIILPRAINNLKVHVYGGDHEFKLIWVGIGVVKVVLKGDITCRWNTTADTGYRAGRGIIVRDIRSTVAYVVCLKIQMPQLTSFYDISIGQTAHSTGNSTVLCIPLNS